jgi:adenylate cyclase
VGKEIERKFLVTGDAWRAGSTGRRIRQGYLSSAKERTVRVRTDGEKGYLTVKGPSTGASRDEFEYEIPLGDAEAMLETLCERPIVEKTRHRVAFGGLTWEIDVFGDENAGLIVAEVELGSETQKVDVPPWAGREVTDDPRYFNSNLARKPFRGW